MFDKVPAGVCEAFLHVFILLLLNGNIYTFQSSRLETAAHTVPMTSRTEDKTTNPRDNRTETAGQGQVQGDRDSRIETAGLGQ